MSKVCSEYECFVKEKEKNPNISLKKKWLYGRKEGQI